MLNNIKFKVLEKRQGKLVITENPERAAYVVRDLTILLALIDKKLAQSDEATLLDKLLGQLVDAQ